MIEGQETVDLATKLSEISAWAERELTADQWDHQSTCLKLARQGDPRIALASQMVDAILKGDREGLAVIEEESAFHEAEMQALETLRLQYLRRLTKAASHLKKLEVLKQRYAHLQEQAKQHPAWGGLGLGLCHDSAEEIEGEASLLHRRMSRTYQAPEIPGDRELLEEEAIAEDQDGSSGVIFLGPKKDDIVH